MGGSIVDHILQNKTIKHAMSVESKKAFDRGASQAGLNLSEEGFRKVLNIFTGRRNEIEYQQKPSKIIIPEGWNSKETSTKVVELIQIAQFSNKKFSFKEIGNKIATELSQKTKEKE